MIIRFTFATLVLFFATALPVQGADVALRRWAVIASPEVQELGLSDLLSVAISKQLDLELVEREQLSLATKELEISSVLGSQDAAQRLKLGQWVRANALVLLTVETREKKSVLKLVISDCVYGARLRTEYFSYEAEKVVPLTRACEEAVLETRRRFEGGIKHLIGVSQFLSKNLDHQYDYLQAGYAELLINALCAHQGVAVLELEDAQAIATELKVNAGELKGRIVPFFIEGDFEVAKKGAEADELVHMIVRLTDGGRVERKGERKELTQSQCVDLLTDALPRRLLQISGDDKTPTLSRERQRAYFSKRAQAFSELHAFKQAAGLREAALLLHPDDHEQRVNLIADYHQWIPVIMKEGQPTVGMPRVTAADRALVTNGWKELYDKQFIALLGMSHHCLELVHRHAINAREASHLLKNLVYTSRMLPSLMVPDGLVRSRGLSDPFYWEMIAAIPRLDPKVRDGAVSPLLRRGLGYSHAIDLNEKSGFNSWSSLRQKLEWQDLAVRALVEDLATAPKPGDDASGKHKHTTVAMLEKFLKETAEVALPLPQMAKIIFSDEFGSFTNSIGRGAIERRDVDLFYERLRGAELEVPRFYGRCGLVVSVYAMNGRLNTEQLQELEDLSKWLTERYAKTPEFERMIAAYQLAFNNIRKANTPGKIATAAGAVKNHPLTTNPIPAIEKNPRVTMRRMESLQDQGDYVAIIPTETLDIFWSFSQIAVMRTPDKIEPIFVADGKWWIQSVVFDGHNIWISTSDACIWVLSVQGKVLAKIGVSEGLPASSVPLSDPREYSHLVISPLMSLTSQRFLLLHAVTRGKVLAMGTMAPHDRKWFAMVSVKSAIDPASTTPYKVQIFHVASKEYSETDTADTTFLLRWFAEYRNPQNFSQRTLVIGRDLRRPGNIRGDHPLEIDLTTAQVRIWRPMESGHSFHNVMPFFDGKMFVRGYADFFPVLPADRDQGELRKQWLKNLIAIEPNEHSMDFASIPIRSIEVLRPPLHPTWVWNSTPGGSSVLNPLSTSPLPLQHRFQFHGRSIHHGLVAWNSRDHFYQVEIAPQATTTAAPWQDEYVPPSQYLAHHEAAEKLRRLGGSVDGAFEHSLKAETDYTKIRPRWGTYVVLSESWRGTANDLALLKDLHNLTHVYAIKAATFDDDQVRRFGEIKTIEKLYLEETAVTNAGLLHFREHPNLRYLRLEGTMNGKQFDDDAIETVMTMPMLLGLTLYGSGFSDSGIAPLKQAPKLQTLFLIDTKVTQQSAATLMRDLRTNKKPNSTVSLSPLTELRTRPTVY